MSREKQIEEMAKDIAEAINHNSAVDVIRHGLICVNSEGVTRELYDDGYRKRSEGEWKILKMGDGEKVRTCSACNISQTVNVYKGKVMFMFCPYCGAKMKGGAE